MFAHPRNETVQLRILREDTGATFWNELEEETELYEGREQDLMGAPQLGPGAGQGGSRYGKARWRPGAKERRFTKWESADNQT
eukprot:Skav211438  [mRNA]  locus=scaffold1591:186598:187774:- [translate_table: standard]